MIKRLFFHAVSMTLAVVFAGCMSTQQAVPESARSVRAADLDLACAELIVQFLSSSSWDNYAKAYAARVLQANPQARARNCVPLIFLSEIKNSLRTRAGNPLNYALLSDKFTHCLNDAEHLDEYVRNELQVKYPELYQKLCLAKGDGWEWNGPEAAPRLRVSRGWGMEQDKSTTIAAQEWLRFLEQGVRRELPPDVEKMVTRHQLDLALRFKMEPDKDHGRCKITADLIDFRNCGEIVWSALVWIQL